MTDRLVQHYAQQAHNRGGGLEMALNMMAEDLRRAWDGLPPLYPAEAPASRRALERIASEGHGHVLPRPDGGRMRCGGPALCARCRRDAAEVAAIRRGEHD